MTNTTQQPTFYVHDYETFGKHPARDRPAQFAGVRTDADFNIIEDPLVIYCQPADDYLPDPEAVMITGITPQIAGAKGVVEAEFARSIHEVFSQPQTCILGYNNIRFDDEFTRHLFYRNFIDPYAYSWQQGNSRWDLLDMLRTCYALRPDGIEWPLNEEGLPSFRLELLTRANGIEHEQAHDALADVYATIAMARLVKQAQPRLFDYLLQLRNKQRVAAQIDIVNMTPLVHVSGMFGAWRNNISLVAPLAWHPENKNGVIVCDLLSDISPLITLDGETLRQRLYTRYQDLAQDELPIPLKVIHINRCPVLAPLNTLKPEDAERLNIDLQYALSQQQQLLQSQVRDKVSSLYESNTPISHSDVDCQLYQGFFSDADRAAMQIIRQCPVAQLSSLDLHFNDRRIAELLFRYRARNYPATLNSDEQHKWLQHRMECLSEQRLSDYLQTLNDLAWQYEGEQSKIPLLKALFEYGQKLLGL
ncbi:MAG: exodeoxyribonuclease I [Enterobacteriaceae bacterium]